MSENIDNERGKTFTAQKPMTDPSPTPVTPSATKGVTPNPPVFGPDNAMPQATPLAPLARRLADEVWEIFANGGYTAGQFREEVYHRLLPILEHHLGLTRAQPAPLAPSSAMIEAGAQRLVRWEDGSVWPTSWNAIEVAGARNEAERVWRSMWLAARKADDTHSDGEPDLTDAWNKLQAPTKRLGLTARPKVEDAEVANRCAQLRAISSPEASIERRAADLLERLAGELAEREAELAAVDTIIDNQWGTMTEIDKYKFQKITNAAITRHAARQQQKENGE